jgi:HEAT repeat protein
MRRWWIPGALALVVCCLPRPGQAAGPAPLSNVEPAVAAFGKALTDPGRPLSERVEIARAFAGWATPQVRELLLTALKDPAPEVRAEVAQALGWPGNREAVAALRARVEATDEADTVKAAAVRSLGRIGDRSVRSLVVAATQSPDKGVREAALWSVALGSLVDPADRTSYLLRLAADRALWGQVRCDAIRALAEVKEDRVVETLLQILEHEPRPKVALPAGQPTQQEIMRLRYAQTQDVPAWAAKTLGQLDDRRAMPLLLKAAEDPDDFFLRLMSLQVLIAWSAAEARPVFMRRLEDSLPDNRVMALVGLGKLGDRTATASVLSRLSDDHPTVRTYAVATLALIGDATVRPALEALQKRESDADVLAALDSALSKLPR